MKKLLMTFVCLLASTAVAQVNLTLSSPTSYATVTAPISVKATAQSSKPITGWRIYLDSKDTNFSGSSSSISTSIPATQGTHNLVIRAWDSSGTYGTQYLTVTVNGTASTSPLPTPPSGARKFSNIDQMTGWNSCGTTACAGGRGTGSYWMALNQTTPSIDGSSMVFQNQGIYSNALWWKKLGADNAATNFLWDFYVLLDDASLTSAQTLEYDAFQFFGGYTYMMGTQCNYAAKVWDTWNQLTNEWIHTTIPCPKFTPGVWHHVQWYIKTNHTNKTYTYKTLVVDGKVYTLNQTQPAKDLGWIDNVGVQYQLDVNKTGGAYKQWVDKSTLTVW